ncbi:MAG: methyltransferase domain-containing protein [Minisyncoccia bacterium]
MNQSDAKEIVASVKDAYNKVATPFVASRARDWDEFEIITPYINSTITLLDAGCAHGRLVPTLLKHNLKKENYTGIDISENLIDKAKELFPDIRFDVGDVCNLPYQDSMFDVTISSAVLHHIPSQELRVQMIQELVRVTKPGGKIILLVWNAFHFPHLWKSITISYIKALFTFGKYERGDMYLPFFGKDTKRYVHAFTEKSLRKLFVYILDLKNTAIEIKNTGKNFFISITK